MLMRRISTLPLESIKANIRDQSLDVISQLMRKHATNAPLVLLGVSIAFNVDTVENLPPVSPDTIATVTGWIEGCYYEAKYRTYCIKAPLPFKQVYKVDIFFSMLDKVTVSDDQMVALAKAMQPHHARIQEILKYGNASEKWNITYVLEGIIKCDAMDSCDFVRDILVNTGRSIYDIIRMEKNIYEIHKRISWISRHVPNNSCCYDLGRELGSSHDEVKSTVARNNDLGLPVVSMAEDIFSLWKKKQHGVDEATSRGQLLQALQVIPVKIPVKTGTC
eukprot:GHVT01019907.1.p1 GENE.GHVT01019907.1~~GHVT01019907.1.p1  ORF type:complete len:277 (+),score=8.49 GHVT01019907.1:1096-1926(+)